MNEFGLFFDGAVVSMYDISERDKVVQELKKAKSNVEESEKLLAKIAENYPNSFLSIIEKDLTIGFTSGKEFKRQNLNPQDFVGLTVNQVFGPHTQTVKRHFLKTFKGEECSFELYINNQHQLYQTVPLFSEDNKILKILSVAENITSRKNAEKELQNAKEKAEESDRLKTEFISNMSHEIRTPMNGILGFSNLLRDTSLNKEKQNSYISLIQNSGNQLLNIIDDILEISKLGTKQVVAVENQTCLNDILLGLFSIFDIKAKENKIPLYIRKGLPDEESIIYTDETKLNKILSNLLENALKFTKEGFVEIGYQLKNGSIEIYVKDTGIGIKPEKQNSIFKRFSQEEKDLSKNVGGLGLGLSIAKENAELLGGSIALISEKGKGATFFVTIPYKPIKTKADQSDSEVAAVEEKHDSHTILIVEDEENNCLFLDELLRDISDVNFKILCARNGQVAVEVCEHDDSIDLVLMDIKMPIMNGFEATRLIKEFRPNLPIVAQTAYTTSEDREKVFSVGCDGFIAKPIDPSELRECIDQFLK